MKDSLTLLTRVQDGCCPPHTEPVVANKDGNIPVDFTPNMPLAYDISGIETESLIELKFTGKGKVNYLKILVDAK